LEERGDRCGAAGHTADCDEVHKGSEVDAHDAGADARHGELAQTSVVALAHGIARE
jgi:hypothetical protein